MAIYDSNLWCIIVKLLIRVWWNKSNINKNNLLSCKFVKSFLLSFKGWF